METNKSIGLCWEAISSTELKQMVGLLPPLLPAPKLLEFDREQLLQMLKKRSMPD